MSLFVVVNRAVRALRAVERVDQGPVPVPLLLAVESDLGEGGLSDKSSDEVCGISTVQRSQLPRVSLMVLAYHRQLTVIVEMAISEEDTWLGCVLEVRVH